MSLWNIINYSCQNKTNLLGSTKWKTICLPKMWADFAAWGEKTLYGGGDFVSGGNMTGTPLESSPTDLVDTNWRQVQPTRRNFERCEPPTKKWHHSSICQVSWHNKFMPPWAGRNQFRVFHAKQERALTRTSRGIVWGIMFTLAACTQSQLGGCMLTWARTVACCYDSIIMIWLRFPVSTRPPVGS